QDIDFKRKGAKKIFSYKMRDLEWTKTIETLGEGKAQVEVNFVSPKDTLINASFFTIDLPKEFGPETTFSFINQDKVALKDLTSGETKADFKAPVQGVTIESPTRKLEITFATPSEVTINREETALGKLRLKMVLAA